MKKQDLFEKKSKNWDMSSTRVKNAKEIADVILKNISIQKEMVLADFGAGTGLLTYFLAPNISKIVAIDNSKSMLDEFLAKQNEFLCDTEVIYGDISECGNDLKFDGVVSSMTIHHVENIKELFLKLFNMVNSGGFIAIADLDSEDGTFHGDNTGVFHFGFDRGELEAIAKEVGFDDIKFETANIIEKPNGAFTVFAMTATKIS
ncbi:putative methyltransferase [Sulfurovum sp. enrichment culture clone C5]|uniref:Putative methyltransferase n=1 Tax=Sulfurovum sp. enrichment culture clone C5 TaxID=497650 RepID=A0A0S4XMN3_9BACT|nr:putative methyltransferase [Sulfurovum sp. enrichment culture clone C5]